MSRILIIEDEQKIASFVKQGFSQDGFVADVASNGIDGLHLATTSTYDLIVLDVMLPGRDGWSVLQEIRKHRPDQPVILLTALDAVSHRVKGLTAGADDYLVKPFAFSELMARVLTSCAGHRRIRWRCFASTISKWICCGTRRPGREKR